MKIIEFILKPRRLANTFWLWGLLYPLILAVFLSPLALLMFPGEGEYIEGYGYPDGIPEEAILYLISIFIFIFLEILFSIYLSFKAMSDRPRIGRYIIGILQLVVSIQFIIIPFIAVSLDYYGFD